MLCVSINKFVFIRFLGEEGYVTSYQQRWLGLAAVSGFLVVALGAFAAHGLKPYLDERAQEWFKLATTYQMWHTLALFGLAATLIEKNKGFRLAAWGAAVCRFALPNGSYW